MNSGLSICNLAQISMDGPSVNWKFFTDMKKKLADDYETILINIGSCGLHIVHNSFKTGVTAAEWKVEALLSSLYYLLKDSPARREDFSKVFGSTRLPLKFVNHRWLENETVCERALELWEDILKYVKAVESKEITKPGKKSYETVIEASKGKLIRAKLHFFKCVAGQIRPFLAIFQNDKPLTPFLSSELCNIIRSLMRRFVKKEVLTKCPALYSVVKNLSALNPREMASNVKHCISRFKKVVTQLVSVRRIKESDCEAIIQEYTSFLDSIPAFGSDRLDELLSTYMNTDPYHNLFKVVQLLLVLSHGQATVERGFSVNTELEVENLAN